MSTKLPKDYEKMMADQKYIGSINQNKLLTPNTKTGLENLMDNDRSIIEESSLEINI